MTQHSAARAHPDPVPDAGHGEPDPRALAVAGALQRDLPEAEVLLFGSRATGNWRPRSDIDLAVIGAEEHTEPALKRQAKPHAKTAYGEAAPHVQIVHFTRAEFDRCRTSRPHIAGQVQRYGLTPHGGRLPPVAQDDPWPGIEALLKICQALVRRMLLNFAGNEDGRADRDDYNFEVGHSALKAALAAALAAAGGDVRYDDNLLDLARQLPDAQRVRLFGLLPPAWLRELAAFRAALSHADDGDLPWPSIDADSLIAAVQRACGQLAGAALAATGRTPREIGYEPCAEEALDGALGGWESLPLDYFSLAALKNRARRRARQCIEQRITTDARVEAMRTLCREALTAAQIDEVERNWRHHGPPDDAVVRIRDVMDDRIAWRDLLVEPQPTQSPGPSDP